MFNKWKSRQSLISELSTFYPPAISWKFRKFVGQFCWNDYWPNITHICKENADVCEFAVETDSNYFEAKLA